MTAPTKETAAQWGRAAVWFLDAICFGTSQNKLVEIEANLHNSEQDQAIIDKRINGPTGYKAGQVMNHPSDPMLTENAEIRPEPRDIAKVFTQHVSLPVGLKALITMVGSLNAFALFLPQLFLRNLSTGRKVAWKCGGSAVMRLLTICYKTIKLKSRPHKIDFTFIGAAPCCC